MNRKNSLLAGLLFISLILTGCASTSSIPEDHYYRLTSLEPKVRFSDPKIVNTLVVDRVKAFGIYHERAILFTRESNPETLKYHHYHHWIDKPAVLLREQLIHYLREAGFSDYVVEGSGRQDGDVHLQLNLKQFERQLHANGDVDVTITVNASVILDKNQPPVLFRDYSVVSRAEDGSMSATIRAFNQGLGNLYQSLTDELIQSVKLSGV